MRKVSLWTLVALALAIPAAAVAEDGHDGGRGQQATEARHHGNGNGAALAAARRQCGAERRQIGVKAFRAKYGWEDRLLSWMRGAHPKLMRLLPKE